MRGYTDWKSWETAAKANGFSIFTHYCETGPAASDEFETSLAHDKEENIVGCFDPCEDNLNKGVLFATPGEYKEWEDKIMHAGYEEHGRWIEAGMPVDEDGEPDYSRVK